MGVPYLEEAGPCLKLELLAGNRPVITGNVQSMNTGVEAMDGFVVSWSCPFSANQLVREIRGWLHEMRVAPPMDGRSCVPLGVSLITISWDVAYYRSPQGPMPVSVSCPPPP